MTSLYIFVLSSVYLGGEGGGGFSQRKTPLVIWLLNISVLTFEQILFKDMHVIIFF